MNRPTQAGSESDILPTPQIGDDDDLFLDDDVEVSLVREEPRRGQNEDDFGDDEFGAADPSDAGLEDVRQPAIKDRIMRERRLRQEAERNSILQAEALERQVLEAEKKSLNTQREALRAHLDGVDVRIRTATEALKMARQDGDTAAETDIEQQLGQLREIRREVENRTAQLPDERALDQAYINHVNNRRAMYEQRAQSESAGARPLNRMADQWAKANGAWFNEDQGAMESLARINEALVAEGYDANRPDFYTELTRRMSRANPGLQVRGLGEGRQMQRAVAPPVAGVRSVAPQAAPNRNRQRVDIGPSDRRMLKMLGIDLSNKEMVSRYAKEKLTRMRSENQGRG